MNELEREIEEKKSTIVPFSGESGRDIFKAGANFILEKNLTAKILVWFMNLNTEELGDVLSKTFDPGSPDKSAENMSDYWLNNVYGK